MIEINELPTRYGFPLGIYHLRIGSITVRLLDAEIVDGATVSPVEGKTVARLQCAYGGACKIVPADMATAALCVAHLRDIGKHARADEIETSYFSAAAVSEPSQAVELGAPLPDALAASLTVPAVESTLIVDESLPAIASAPTSIDAIDDIGTLRVMADAAFIDVDPKWNAKRLRLEIRKARGE